MAKVKGPLMSLSASGSLAGLVSYRMSKDGPQGLKKPQRMRKQNQLQDENRQRMIDARASFKTLSVDELASWQNVANWLGGSPWQHFFAEYQRQQTEAGQKPLIPSPEL